MSRYTGNGDRGTTELVRMKNVSKSDDRISLLGTIEELSAHLGLLKTEFAGSEAARMLENIQIQLHTVSTGVSDPYSKEGRMPAETVKGLEQAIKELEDQFEYPVSEKLPGSSRLSAEIEIARTVARRAERALASVGVKFGADTGAKSYMNRLGDYLYALAYYADIVSVHSAAGTEPQDSFARSASKAEAATGIAASAMSMEADVSGVQENVDAVSERVVREVLRQMGIQGKITLDAAKRLIERIEAEAERRGKKAVIAVCGPDGNPVAVHVMDGAFLVSFDVAVKKAYTSVAVKMSTMELNALAQPGGTFYGLDKLEGGNIIIFGGGIPLKVGDTIIGGLGVSGGTGEEDHSLAEFGLSVLHEIL